MSNMYSDLIYTNFPDQKEDRYEYMQDINLSTYNLAKKYETLMSQNKFEEAAQFLIDNPSLNRIMLNAEKYNKLSDSIRAVQRLFSDDIQKYVLELVKNKGNYQSNTRYSKYDVIYYDSMPYLCTSINTPINTLPTDTNYFYPLSIKGEKGDRGSDGIGLSFDGIWDDNITYNLDAAVTYNSILYASKVDNNKGHTPSNTSLYWQEVFNLQGLNVYDNSTSNVNYNTYKDALDALFSFNTDIANEIDSIFDSTYSNSTDISTMKNKLDGIQAGAQVNTVTGVKGVSEDKFRTGNITLTKNNIGLGNVNNTSDVNKSVKYATDSGNADTVDGIHVSYGVNNEYGLRSIGVGTSELIEGVSALATGTIYIQYE